MFDYFDHRISYLKNEISSLESSITAAPVGRLRVYANGQYSRWVLLLPDGSKKYIRKTEKETARKLWRKQQDIDRLNFLKKELAILDRSGSALKKLYLPEKSKAILHTNSYMAKDIADFSKVDDWASLPYQKNPYKRDEMTEQGPFDEKMRSKSEVIIGMALVMHDIKYRYECEFPLNGRSVYPDFMIKRPSDEKIVIWEHFGMWDVPEYQRSAIEKINEYLSSGLVPYEDFIYSIETGDAHLNPELVNDMIRAFILR